MDSVLDILNLNALLEFKSANVMISGYSASGKTRISVALTKELLDLGKSVLYIGEDKRLFGERPNLTYITMSMLDVEEVLSDVLPESNHDVVIIDGLFLASNIQELVTKYQKIFISTSLLNRNSTNVNSLDFRKFQFADYYGVLGVPLPPKPKSFITKIIDFLLFWKPKPLLPNKTLTVIKNRFGSCDIKNIFINFAEAKLKLV